MKSTIEEGRLATLRQEWKERLEKGETPGQILAGIKGKTERKLAAILFVEWLREKPEFADDQFFIDQEGKRLLMSLTGEKFSKKKKNSLRKLGFELVKEETELISTKLEEEKKLPPTKLKEAKELPYVPIDRDFYGIVPYVTPYRITENNLMHKEILKDNSLALKYKIESRGKNIIYNFLIPAEVLGKIKEKDIPTVGLNMRRSLIGALGFAFVQNTTSPNFKRSELLEFIGENPQKTRKLYSDLDKGLLTWAYGTYTIISGDKISEVGHIINRVKLAKKRGDKTLVEFNSDVVKPLFRSQMDTGTLRYISYPIDLLKVRPKEMKLYVRNFCESLLKKQGMGREVYPKFVKNILIQDFGIPSKKLRKLSNEQIHDIFMEGTNEAKDRGFLEDCMVTEESQKKALYNIRKWKIKLITSSKPEDDSY